MSTWDLLNRAIAKGVIKPEELTTGSITSAELHRASIQAGTYASAERQRKEVIRMLSNTDGSVSPFGQLVIRLNRGKMPPEGSDWNAFKKYKALEIIDVRIAGETAYVTLSVKHGKPIIVEDGAELFPSDRLISQLYTLAG